jgi:hypothetical protein
MTFFTSSPSAGEGRPELWLRQSAPKRTRTIFAVEPRHKADREAEKDAHSNRRRGCWPCRPLSQNQSKTATDSGEIPRTEALVLRVRLSDWRSGDEELLQTRLVAKGPLVNKTRLVFLGPSGNWPNIVCWTYYRHGLSLTRKIKRRLLFGPKSDGSEASLVTTQIESIEIGPKKYPNYNRYKWGGRRRKFKSGENMK